MTAPLSAQTIRVATYDVSLTRKGPGVLLGDLQKGKDAQIAAIIKVITAARPDILVLQRFDHDPKGRALDAFRARLRAADGPDYPYMYNGPVNAGEPSGLDLDGNGMTGDWADAFGWGKFPGQGGMAILSRFAIDEARARSFQNFLWRDLPDAQRPKTPQGALWPDAETADQMRLSSVSHWDVPIALPEGDEIRLLVSNPTVPLYDGPERHNVWRNHDEIGFWVQYLDGAAVTDDAGVTAPIGDARAIVMGNLNIDPVDGKGEKAAIHALLAHPHLQDVSPQSGGGQAAAIAQGGRNAAHAGLPERDTADWSDDKGPGNLRVDYVLPDARLRVVGSGVLWPDDADELAEAVIAASAHRLVWVDIALP